MRAAVSPSRCHFHLCVLTSSLLLLAVLLAFCGTGVSQETAQTPPRPLITQMVDEARLTTLRGNTHPMARPEFDLGTAPASLPMERMLLVLKRSPEQELGLRKLLDDQQDKDSANYHKWMTPEQFGTQFGASDSDMQTITAWLQSHGFQVGATKGRSVLEFSGSASQVQEAFHTAIHKYVVNGEQHWANATDPQIPVALAPAVAGVTSLHDFRKKAMSKLVGKYSVKTKQLEKPEPNYTYACGGGECYAVVPYDFATIYDVLPLWNAGTNGAGQTIAIVGRTDINPSDANTFWSLFGLTVPANKLVITVNGVDPGFTDDEGEANIDVQWSGAVAPQATIQYVTSASTTTTDGVDLSALYIVDNNLAPVMSESYGQCELGLGTAGNQFYNALWAQAAAQGISVFVSTGDNGSAGCDFPGGPAQYGLAVNGLASTPYNAAIGGTDFNEYKKWTTYWSSTNASGTQLSAKGYIPETTWDDSCTNPLAITLGYGSTAEAACNNSQMIAEGGVNSEGGSGGPSNCVLSSGSIGSCTAGYAKPSWQSAAGVPNDHLRDLPDVSLFASNGFLGSFYVICQQDQTFGVCNLNNFLGYGGTSVASPAFAGIMALVNQKTGSAQGVPGFALYQLVSKQANAFHDVPSGSTIAMPCWSGSPNCTTKTAGDTFGVLNGYATTTGYDLATGLGSVDAANLVNNWTKATFTATTTTLQLNNGSAVSAVHGAAVPVSITISPTAASGNASLLVSTGTGTTTGKAIDVFSLTSGAVTGTTKSLPGGSYNVIAHYGGDGTYGGSYSTAVPVTISKENSTVGLTGVTTSGGAVTSVAYDASYWVTLDVENSKGALCSPVVTDEVACPTGTVTLTDNGNPYGGGTYNVFLGHLDTSSGQLTALTGGSHTLQAQYGGDASYNAGSKSIVITVNKAITSMQGPYSQGTDYTLPVDLSTTVLDYNAQSYDLAPAGTVTFYNGSTAISGPVSYGTNGTTLTASLSTTFPAPGSYPISAKYSGDQNYQGSTAGITMLNLQYPIPALTLTPDGQVIQAGGTATLTSLVDSTNKTTYPTGMVTLVNSYTGATVAGPTTCTQAKDSSGNFACKVVFNFQPTATLVVYSKYSGNTLYPASNSSTVTINVPDFSLSSGLGSVIVTQGQSQTATIDVNALSGFTGVVNNFACTAGLPPEMTCSFSPAQVTDSGLTTLTISTMPVGQARRRASLKTHGTGWMALMLLPLLGICAIGVAPARRRGALALLLSFAMMGAFVSCGGSGAGGGGGGQQNNPVPTITSLSPSQQAAGSRPQIVIVKGTGFLPTTTATVGGGNVGLPAYSSSTQLSISVPAESMQLQGSLPVVVFNRTPGGGPSNAMDFVVTTGTPTGTFNVTVTASSGTVNHSTDLRVVVQ